MGASTWRSPASPTESPLLAVYVSGDSGTAIRSSRSNQSSKNRARRRSSRNCRNSGTPSQFRSLPASLLRTAFSSLQVSESSYPKKQKKIP
ncbi:unnamed protein product, partial [Nesidiocoris tenuis]